MLEQGQTAPRFELKDLEGESLKFEPAGDGRPALLVFFETDCPTCRLTFPYLNRLAGLAGNAGSRVIGISQDGVAETARFAEAMGVQFPILLDSNLEISRLYGPVAVPTLFLTGPDGSIARTQIAFDKAELNEIAGLMLGAPTVIADAFDGNPAAKPGCTSRHLEEADSDAGQAAPALDLYSESGNPASRIELADDTDPVDYCLEHGFDPLPVVPPTVEKVARMVEAAGLPPERIVARVPPNYGAATVEKVAASAVMAGCRPEMMRVLLPLVRAACDEKFNIHGVQATTHFAAPLIIVNGPIRRELGFASGSNVFSNVTRANSTLGRALQLILTNIGGARPGEMDMSTLGNPGKFSYCIAENEEESLWEPFHVEQGFRCEQSAVTLFAAEPPRGVSEHNARKGRTILKAICRNLATVFGYRMCLAFEAFVIICPEHFRTLHRDGFTKQAVRQFLFENTGIPLGEYEDGDGDGVQYLPMYQKATIDGVECYRKFADPSQIKIVVAGGTAGKFSAVIGSWATGPRGSQVVTYPID